MNQEGDINGENNGNLSHLWNNNRHTPVITPFCAEATPPNGIGARADERFIHGEVAYSSNGKHINHDIP